MLPSLRLLGATDEFKIDHAKKRGAIRPVSFVVLISRRPPLDWHLHTMAAKVWDEPDAATSKASFPDAESGSLNSRR